MVLRFADLAKGFALCFICKDVILIDARPISLFRPCPMGAAGYSFQSRYVLA